MVKEKNLTGHHKAQNALAEALKSYNENTRTLQGKNTQLRAKEVTSAWDLISEWDSNVTQLHKGKDFSWFSGF